MRVWAAHAEMHGAGRSRWGPGVTRAWGPVPWCCLPPLSPALCSCSSPSSRLTSQLPVPRGILLGAATNSFLCMGHSGVPRLCMDQLAGNRCPPTSQRWGLHGYLRPTGSQGDARQVSWKSDATAGRVCAPLRYWAVASLVADSRYPEYRL